jgi:RHS repeat-associated protein
VRALPCSAALPRCARATLRGCLTTWYLPGYEQETNSDTGATENKYTLSAGGRTFAIFVDKYTAAAPGGTPNDLRYLHQDQLGSVVAITNATGGVIELLSYDAFGKRRNPDGSDATVALLPQNDRGYTGHEMLDSVGLIHMNGRIYDPNLGRFLSADPFIQAAGMTLSYNRYAYVMNNPLVLTDPSGYSWWTSLRNALCPICDSRHRREVLGLAVGLLTQQWWLVQGFWGGAIAAGAAGGFTGTLVVSGGDVRAAAQGALTGGMMGWAGGIGPAADSWERYAAHAFAGCVSGAVQGGGCGRGAAAAVTGKFITNQVPDDWSRPSQGIAAAFAGGTASVITGGKFSDGARTAAYGYLFNCLAHECDGAKYDQKDPTYHSYVPFATDVLCNTSTAGCVDAARLEMSCNSAPSQGACVGVGGKDVNQNLPGITSANPVTQYRPNPDMIINGTSDGHIFNDGYVVRWLSVDAAGDVRIWTAGLGINTATPFKWLNEIIGDVNQVAGKQLFVNIGKENVQNVRAALQSPFGRQ